MRTLTYFTSLILLTLSLPLSGSDVYSLGRYVGSAGAGWIMLPMLMALTPTRSALFAPLPSALNTLVAVVAALLVLRRLYLLVRSGSLTPPAEFKGLTYAMALAALGFVLVAALMTVLMPPGGTFLAVLLVLLPAGALLPLAFLATELQNLFSRTRAAPGP